MGSVGRGFRPVKITDLAVHENTAELFRVVRLQKRGVPRFIEVRKTAHPEAECRGAERPAPHLLFESRERTHEGVRVEKRLFAFRNEFPGLHIGAPVIHRDREVINEGDTAREEEIENPGNALVPGTDIGDFRVIAEEV